MSSSNLKLPDLKADHDTQLEQKHRFEDVVKNPNIMDMVCGFIADGGNLQELTVKWMIPYGLMSNWISRDATRRSRYENAQKDKVGWLGQRIEAELKDMSFNHGRFIKDSDKIKALELLGKTVALYITKHEHTVEKTLEDLLVESNTVDDSDVVDGEIASLVISYDV